MPSKWAQMFQLGSNGPNGPKVQKSMEINWLDMVLASSGNIIAYPWLVLSKMNIYDSRTWISHWYSHTTYIYIHLISKSYIIDICIYIYVYHIHILWYKHNDLNIYHMLFIYIYISHIYIYTHIIFQDLRTMEWLFPWSIWSASELFRHCPTALPISARIFFLHRWQMWLVSGPSCLSDQAIMGLAVHRYVDRLSMNSMSKKKYRMIISGIEGNRMSYPP